MQAQASQLAEQGRQIFRFDTFGDEKFWGDSLKLHRAVAGAANGGVGPGLSPRAALGVGLKVDVDALPPELQQALARGRGQPGRPRGHPGAAQAERGGRRHRVLRRRRRPALDGHPVRPVPLHRRRLVRAGHRHRLDGWATRDLNVGAIVSLAPDLRPVARLLGTDVGHRQAVLAAWGPGKFDAELFLDGKGFRPDGKTAATLIPPAYGLAGVNLHT